MSQNQPAETKYLADYQPYPFKLTETRLHFSLSDEATVVRSALDFTRQQPGPLVLDGGKDVRLLELSINGQPLPPDSFTRDDERLIIEESALCITF